LETAEVEEDSTPRKCKKPSVSRQLFGSEAHHEKSTDESTPDTSAESYSPMDRNRYIVTLNCRKLLRWENNYNNTAADELRWLKAELEDWKQKY